MKLCGFSIGDLWKLKKASDQFERDKKMQNYEWQKSLKAGVTQILTLILTGIIAAVFGVLSDSENIKTILLGAGVNEAYVAVILMLVAGGLRVAQNWMKHSPNAPRPSSGDIPAVVALLLLPALASPAFAQEPTPQPAPVEITLHGGAMQFAERGQPDKRDFVYRLTLTVPAPSGLTLFARADYTRTQDGGDLLDPKTFRSIEGFVGGRKDIGSGFAVTAFGGATWNRDSKIEPTDPRLYTAAAGVRYSVPGRGYVIAAAGHHGPVGGTAFLGSVVYEINSGASWFGDVAIPLDASRFAARPYTAKVGISARLKGWKF